MKPTAAIRTLRIKLVHLTFELATCATPAMRRCVKETMRDAEQQIWVLSQGAR